MQSDKYKINLQATIGKILPYYARGRKMSLFLEAICHPIEMLHNAWIKWAEEKIVEASVTSQALPLAWFLKYKLSSHFINEGDEFVVNNGIETPTNFIFTENEYFLSDEYSKHIYNEEENYDNLTMTIWSPEEILDDNINFTILAPEIKETSTYGTDEYMHDITKLTNQYNTSFKTYKIIIK